MNNRFVLTQTAGQKLELAIQRNDGSNEDVEYLSINDNFRAVTLLRTGKAKLVEITECGLEGSVIPTVPKPVDWTLDNEGNIHFTLSSFGLSYQEWTQYFERRHFRIDRKVHDMLLNTNEAETSGVAYNIVVRPSTLIEKGDRTMKKIREYARKKEWITPHWEVAYLIRDTFTDDCLAKMGFSWIVTMHQPVTDLYSRQLLLSSRRSAGGRLLHAYSRTQTAIWSNNGGFAFVYSKS